MDGILVNIHTPSGESWRPSELSRCTHIAESTSSATVLLIAAVNTAYRCHLAPTPKSLSVCLSASALQHLTPMLNIHPLSELSRCSHNAEQISSAYRIAHRCSEHCAQLSHGPCTEIPVGLPVFSSALHHSTHQHLSSHTASALWRISPLSTFTRQLEVVMATCLLTFA